VRIDKGAGVRSLLAEVDVTNAIYVGDDTTDLDAFRALAELGVSGELDHAIRVGVRSDDGPDMILEEADLIVEGTDGVRRLLELLLTEPPA
jgi:trehalose 6-phosphate phosphatase